MLGWDRYQEVANGSRLLGPASSLQVSVRVKSDCRGGPQADGGSYDGNGQKEETEVEALERGLQRLHVASAQDPTRVRPPPLPPMRPCDHMHSTSLVLQHRLGDASQISPHSSALGR